MLLGEYADRLTLAVPGTRFDAELVLDTLARLAKAVGGSPDNWPPCSASAQEKPRRSQ